MNTYAYSPRGVRLLAQSTEPVARLYRFAGNDRDPTGLYHLKARYCDAKGRPLHPTRPVGEGRRTPCLHAEGGPVNRIDPDGLLSFGAVIGVGDWASLVRDALSADTESAEATAREMLAGIGVEGLRMAGRRRVPSPTGTSHGGPRGEFPGASAQGEEACAASSFPQGQ